MDVEDVWTALVFLWFIGSIISSVIKKRAQQRKQQQPLQDSFQRLAKKRFRRFTPFSIGRTSSEGPASPPRETAGEMRLVRFPGFGVEHNAAPSRGSAVAYSDVAFPVTVAGPRRTHTGFPVVCNERSSRAPIMERTWAGVKVSRRAVEFPFHNRARLC